MLFSSFSFLLAFLPITVLGNAILRRFAGPRAAQLWLLLASLFFYAYPQPSHLALLIASIVCNWALVRVMVASSDPKRRKLWMLIALIGNIALLCSFKYVNFALGQIGLLTGSEFRLPNWDAPLGISFFTLTQVMYLVDCYQEMNAPVSLFDHATVVSFFPYVSSGPLVRTKEIADQLVQAKPRDEQLELARRGLFLLALGLTKKVVFADTFAACADIGFASATKLSTLEAWVFSLSYTFQIYYDFSGYSDMAVGVAWLLGFEIPQNFKTPYISKSISEFWQRWHISLSNFITNYLFTPILRAFPKATLRASMIATLLAMTIAGLWHGPAYTYILFGVIHGVALAINQYWKRKKLKLPRGVGWFLTFMLVNAAFVVFRSANLGVAAKILTTMVLPHGNLMGMGVLENAVPMSPTIIVRPIVIGVVLAFIFKSSWEYALAFKASARTSLATAILLVLSFFYLNSSVAKRFVYFAF